MVLRQNNNIKGLVKGLGCHIGRYLLDTTEQSIQGLVQSQKDLMSQFWIILQ